MDAAQYAKYDPLDVCVPKIAICTIKKEAFHITQYLIRKT
jgi:hypothetical protein